MRQYEAYKDSGVEWISKIPSHWDLKKIKYNFSIYAGATPRTEKEENWNGEINWITPADYKTSDKYVSRGQKTITEIGYNSCNTQIVPQGSIIFSKRAPIGTVAISANSLCTNQGCLSCVPLNANALFHYYCMSVATEFFNLLGSGTTFKEISANVFANVKIPCPPLPEQQAIATYLDEKTSQIDRIIESREKKIKLLEELKASIISNAVTKGIRKDVETKDSGIEWIGRIPKHWEMTRLKFCGNICSGDGISKDEMMENGAYEVYGGNGLMGYTNTYNVDTDKIIIGRVGARCGNIHISRGKRFITDNSLIFSVNKSANFEYLTFYMIAADFNKLNTSSAQPLITGTKVMETKFPLPPLNEQHYIANFLEKQNSLISSIIQKEKKEISLLKEFRSSLITEVVTGKRKVI